MLIKSGNPTVDLSALRKVFLTKSLAARILKDDNKNSLAIGNNMPVEVAQIIQDPSPTSHIRFSMVVSPPTFSSDFIGGLPTDNWTMTVRGFSYLVLPEGMTASNAENRIQNMIRKYYKEGV